MVVNYLTQTTSTITSLLNNAIIVIETTYTLQGMTVVSATTTAHGDFFHTQTAH